MKLPGTINNNPQSQRDGVSDHDTFLSSVDKFKLFINCI